MAGQNFKISVDEKQALEAIDNVEKGFNDLNKQAQTSENHMDGIGESLQKASKKGGVFSSILFSRLTHSLKDESAPQRLSRVILFSYSPEISTG